MAHIEVREKADGTSVYKAEVVVTVDGKRFKRSSTFSSLTTARRWSAQKEKEMRAPQGCTELRKPKKPPTVADALERYMADQEPNLKATKKQVLSFVRDGRCELSKLEMRQIQPFHIKAFATELRNGGRSPATVSSYLSHVCHVLSAAEADFGPEYAVDFGALAKGKYAARRNGLAGKATSRTRRPSMDELDTLMEYFIRRSAGDARAIPMALIVAFAIFGVRRQSEITSVRWVDLDDDELLVRSMKDPRKPEGHDRLTQLTKEASRVIEIHGKRDPERIFPYSPNVISRNFTNACKTLNINDLRFHDLRHEGVSWLRERGWETGHVMSVSGHSATSTLDRYTNIKRRGDKYDDWKWWPELEGHFRKI